MSGMASAIDGSPLAMRNVAGPRARTGSRYGDFICQTTWLSIDDRDRYGPISKFLARGSHTGIVVSGVACGSRIMLRHRACSSFCAPRLCGATPHFAQHIRRPGGNATDNRYQRVALVPGNAGAVSVTLRAAVCAPNRVRPVSRRPLWIGRLPPSRPSRSCI